MENLDDILNEMPENRPESGEAMEPQPVSDFADTHIGEAEPALGAEEAAPEKFAYSPVETAESLAEEPAAEEPEAVRPKKKKWKGLVAAGLALALVAGSCGVTAAYLNNRWENRMEDTLESYEDTLKGYENKLDSMEERLAAFATADGVSVSGTPSVTADGSLTPAQVYAQNVDSVVLIYSSVMTSSFFGQTTGTATGSGFVLTETGYVVTNYHVVEDTRGLVVVTSDGREHTAELVGYDKNNDIALLKIEATGLQAVTVGSSDVLIVGDQVAAIGNPLGELTSTLTVGYISAKERDVTTDGTVINMLQTDAAINSGNSGGPLFNMRGEVVGITTAKYSGSTSSGATIEGIGFAIPIDDVIDMFSDLMDYGYITGAYLGVSVLDADSAKIYYGLAADAPQGAYVVSVEPGYCAGKSGMQPGDVIIELGGYEVDGMTDLSRALRKYKAGDSITVTVYRAGSEVQLTVVLDEKPRGDQPVQPENPEKMPSEGNYEEWFDYFFPNGGK